MVLYANCQDKGRAGLKGKMSFGATAGTHFIPVLLITFGVEERKLDCTMDNKHGVKPRQQKGQANKRVNIGPLMENRFSTKNYKKQEVVLTRQPCLNKKLWTSLCVNVEVFTCQQFVQATHT